MILGLIASLIALINEISDHLLGALGIFAKLNHSSWGLSFLLPCPPGLDLLGHAAFWFFIASLPTSFVLSIDKLRFFLLSRNGVRWRPSSSLADSSKTKARKIKHFDEEKDNFITSEF
ncbi:hypothetical protein Q3G72_005363 [Acer saccharum]|nr:hypothetical protein Q3G72_005363 [Acer saccharum]